MKNAMKRVMSILLVAMLLVSALPLAASAKSLMDNLNALPGQETKPTQPAATQAPAATEAPATPAATEATEAPVAASTFALSRESRGGTEQTYRPLYVYFFDEEDLDNPITAVGENGKCTYNGGPATGPTLISEFLDAKFPGKYEFVRIQSGGVSSTSTDYVANIQDAHYDVIVKKNLPITMNVYLEGGKDPWKTETFYGTYTGLSMLNSIFPNWSNSYVQVSGGESKSTVDLNASFSSGTVEVFLTAKGSSATTPSGSTTPTTATTTPSGSTSATETTEYYNKFPYNVYLNIYKDTMVGAPDKTINITKGAAIDGTVTMDEVKALVMNHYKAKDSYGISFDGLYLAEGTWVTNYVTDTEKYDKFIDVDQFRQYRTVYINVMIDNATAKSTSSSSSTADTSNPKTGDSIYAPIAVLGVSATALAAAMFFYNKKRLAR